MHTRCCPYAPHPRISLLNRSFFLCHECHFFRKHMASLKLGSRMPIKYDECMKRTAELELCHLAVPREGSEKTKQIKKRFSFCMRLIILLTFSLRCILFPLIHCMIHCQLQNKAYENDVPDAHIKPFGRSRRLFIVYKHPFQLYFTQAERLIYGLISARIHVFVIDG